MFNLISNEVFKIFAGKKMYFFMIIIVGFTLLPGLESAMGAVDFTVNGQNLPLYMMPTIVNLLIPIFIIILMATMITDEYVSGTLKLPLLHPVSRLKLITAKIVSLVVPISFLLLFAIGAAYLIGTILFGWGDQLIYQGQLSNTVIVKAAPMGILITLGSYLASILPLMIFGILISIVCLLSSSAGVAVAASIGIQIVFSVMGQIVQLLQPFLIVSYTERFPRYIFFTKDFSGIIMSLIVMGIYGIGMYLVTIYLFRKKEILY